ncbi:MAG: NADH:ubiquinone oxidoreductase [Candidatus Fluviicola riflensis]|nr:MAG: GxxExxY protein [Candidatus Fluviicola riflensis]OGS78094.1 MAG: NADH:ubiquinone oxidoreductase [Candidatus Fluviicola riflensis]OGS85160.1 MAG: NADH:ubiquinone oxidoreductase [Fluviicola sp. RIFCSPHIGHO2_01_FULL_43_53]OGS89431.1 MAG: NADH:ubiquinone oxidoreductase [Fluviicola sp. RIFCSPHIGHO2_12_FULL_43_24]
MKTFILKEETYQIIGLCMDVHSELGRGFTEIVYKDALEYEFKTRNIPFEREKEFVVRYRDIILPHKYHADFLVMNNIILEVKTVNLLAKEHMEQTINYLCASGLNVGLLVNFRNSKLEYKRLVY